MKKWSALVLLMAGCTSDLDDVPASPHLSFYAGRLADGARYALQSGERVLPDTEILIDAWWYGYCYERDPFTDEDVAKICDQQPFELTASCEGAACPALAMVNSDDSKAQLVVKGTGTGAIALLASMRNLRNQETPTAIRELELVSPEAVALRDASATLAEPPAFPSVRSASPILRIDGQLQLGGQQVYFASPAFTVNGRAVTAEESRVTIDLRALFPAGVQPDGSLAAGNYELQIEYPGKTWTSSVRVQP